MCCYYQLALLQIAAIFEFTGAIVLGRVSTSIIANGIADFKSFAREPEMLAYGMVCAMTVAGVWQVVASYFEYNVSSTHSIIGCIIGFALVYGGSEAVLWQVG
jgi:solute carrier family 20 (sodium-dependent phosphate transporter)